MGRKYRASDFPQGLPKPRIQPTHRRRQGVATHYPWACRHRPTGSAGYGYTPAHAYAQWLRNYRRRLKFYTEREQESLAFLVRRGLTIVGGTEP